MKHYGSVEITLKYKESWLYRRTYAYIAHHELGEEWNDHLHRCKKAFNRKHCSPVILLQ